MIIAAVFVVAYTALAGMISVAYTDVVNGVLIIVGLAVALPILIVKTGSLGGMGALAPQIIFSS